MTSLPSTNQNLVPIPGGLFQLYTMVFCTMTSRLRQKADLKWYNFSREPTNESNARILGANGSSN